MKLLTAEIKKKMPVQVSGNLEDAPIIVKFFGGCSYTLYVVSAEAYIEGQDEPVALADMNGHEIEDIHLYGYVTGLQFDEWGKTSFKELEAIKFPPFGLPVERDKYFGFDQTIKKLREKGTVK